MGESARSEREVLLASHCSPDICRIEKINGAFESEANGTPTRLRGPFSKWTSSSLRSGDPSGSLSPALTTALARTTGPEGAGSGFGIRARWVMFRPLKLGR